MACVVVACVLMIVGVTIAMEVAVKEADPSECDPMRLKACDCQETPYGARRC